MAIYTYKCGGCRVVKEVWASISAYSADPEAIRPRCDFCPTMMDRAILSAPMMQFDQAAFVSHVDGAVIEGKAQHREYLKRTGLVPYDEVAADIPRNRKATFDASFKDIKEDVAEVVKMYDQGYVPPPVEKVEVADDSYDVDVTVGLEKQIVEALVT